MRDLIINLTSSSDIESYTENPNSMPVNALASWAVSLLFFGHHFHPHSFVNPMADFSRVLVPLSRSKMTLKEKTFMINKFIEVTFSIFLPKSPG